MQPKALLLYISTLFICCMNTELLDRCTLQGWNAQCETQIGSIKCLRITKVSNLLADPECCNEDHEVSGEISMKPGSGFKTYDFKLNQAIFSEQKKEDKHGDYFEQLIEVQRHGIDKDMIQELCRLNNQHTVAVVDLYAGSTRIIGNLKNPLVTNIAANSSGRAQSDTTSADLGFFRKSKCPACFVASDTIIPTLADSQPYSFINVVRPNACLPALITIAPLSRRSNGDLVTPITPSADVQIVYTFGDFKNPLYRASIGPDADPTDISDWTFISGTGTSVEFETNIVDEMQASATGVSLYFNAKLLESIHAGNFIEVHAEVVDQSVYSNIASSKIRFFRSLSLSGTFTGQTVTLIYYSRTDCSTMFQAGPIKDAMMINEGAMTPVSINAGISNNYKFQMYSDPSSLDNLTIGTPSFTGLVGIGGKSNRLRVLSFSAGGAHDLGAFSLRSFPNLQTFSAPSAQITDIDYKVNDNLQDINLDDNSLTGSIDLTILANLGQVYLSNNSLTSVTLGSSKANLSIFDVQGNNLDSAALDALIVELWEMRDDVTGTPTIDLRTNTGSISTDSIARINGTGSYSGEGLVANYSWTINY